MFRPKRLSYAVAAALCAGAAPQAQAQVTIDGSMGGGAGALTGPNYQIQSSFGRQVGANLFHSFGQFNVNTGQSATFLGPNSVSNIIGRVTGGQFSNIDGLVRSSIPGANLFLVNPAGILFGPNASLDVSGAFHASTAHYLALADGGRFDAVNPNGTVLTSAPPSAFGFTSAPVGMIVNGSTMKSGAGGAFTLVSGPMLISGAALTAPGGTLSLAAVGGAGEVQLSQGQATPPAGMARASIQVLNGSALDGSAASASQAAGRVVIRGGVLTIQDSQVGLANTAAGAAQGVTVDAAESLTIERGLVGAIAFGAGTGGPLSLTSPTIILNNSTVTARTVGAAPAGNISIVSTDLTATATPIDARSTGSGPAGNIDIQAARVVVKDNSQIDTSASSAAAGHISVVASESITLARNKGDRAIGETGILNFASGDATGNGVFVSAPTIAVDDAVIRTRSTGSARAGDISLQGATVDIRNGAQIDSSTFGAGAAGKLTIDASRSLTIAGTTTGFLGTGLFTTSLGSGAGGDIVVHSPLVSVTTGFMNASAIGSGPPGGITIEAGKVDLLGGGAFSSSSAAPGPGGRVTITASESFNIAGDDGAGNRSSILGTNTGSGAGSDIAIVAPVVTIDGGAISTASSGGGSGGRVAIVADRIALTAGGQVGSSALAAGPAGNLDMIASESITVSGSGANGPSGFSVSTSGAGDAGTVTLRAPDVTVDGGIVKANTTARGAAGNIVVDATRLAVTDGGVLDSSTASSGRGGRTNITASESVTVSGSSGGPPSAIKSGASASGSAGEVTVAAPLVVLSDDGIVSGETTGAGAGGSIRIDAGRVVLASGGQILSTAKGRGAGGHVTVNATDSVTIAGPSNIVVGTGIFGVSEGDGAGGDIEVNAPVVSLVHGTISATAVGTGAAGNVLLTGGTVLLTGGASIDSSSAFSADAGRVFVDATRSIEVSGADAAGNASRISSGTLGSGRGGQIFLRAPDIKVDQGIVTADALGSGTGGEISLNVVRLSLTRGGQIGSNAVSDATGGKVGVTASESVTISDPSANLGGSGLFAVTLGSGHGGEIFVSAPNVTLQGGAISTSAFGAGDAGRITIQAADVTVARGGTIDSSTRAGGGSAGTVNVGATRSMSVTGRDNKGNVSTVSSFTQGAGNGGDLFLSAPDFTVDDALVSANTSGRGNAGRIGIDAQRVTITNGGVLASGTAAAGDGGTLNVAASESVFIAGSNAEGRSRLSNSSSGAGNAGEIFVSAPTITIQDGGFVRGTASAGGAGASIRIRGGTLALANQGGISTDTTGPGRGGEINVVMTSSVTLGGGSSISASSSGRGDAGGIFIDAGRSLTLNNASITTEADSADGGNIEIKASDFLRMTDSRITTSVGNGFGNGGNVTIDPTFVILDGSQIIANAFGGNGGNIDIVTDALLKSGDSVIDASSALGIQGTIRISAPDSDLAGGLTPLPGGLFDPSQLLRESCSARAGRAGNSFVGVGHGGLPEQPGALAFSSYARGPVAAANERAPVFALLEAFATACER